MKGGITRWSAVFLTMMIIDKSNAKLYSVSDGLQNSIKHWFPENIEINEYCLAKGCPELNTISLCPNGVKISTIKNISEALTKCMKRDLCGIVVDTRPIPHMVMSTEEFWPGTPIEGTFTTLPNRCFLLNVSNIEIDLAANSGQSKRLPIKITMLMPDLQISSDLQYDLSLPSIVSSIIGQPLTVSLTDAKLNIKMLFISTLYVNQTSDNTTFDIKYVNPIIRARPLYCGIDMPPGFPDVLSLMTSSTQVIMESFNFSNAIAAFISKFYRNAFVIASKQCKFNNTGSE